MSASAAIDVIGRIDNSPVYVARGHENALARSLQELRALGSMNMEQEKLRVERRGVELSASYGFPTNTSKDKPFVYSDGIAVIPVHGTLINRFYGSWGFVTGYNFIRAQLNAALDDEDVKTIIFDVNSYGGEVAGCFELADEIFAARGQKSLLAVVDSNCCSAAYAIASATSKIYVTPSGQAGSIGVIAMHVSYQGMLEKSGIEITLIFEDENKADGNPYENLPEDVRKEIKAQIAKRYGEFVALVVKNRGLDSQAVKDTKSKTFRADEAKALGLIDEVKTPTEAVASFIAETGSNDSGLEEDENAMADPVTPAASTPAAAAPPDQAALATAATEAKAAERTRIAAITGHAEAKERPALAQHLALETDMSAEAAAGILAKAAKEAPAAAAAAPAAAAAGVEDAPAPGFAAAMNASDNPNVGADETQDNAQAGGGAPKVSRAKKAMALAGMTPATASAAKH